MLDEWLDAVRLAQAVTDLSDEARDDVDRVVDAAAAASGLTLDRSTLRAMALAFAAAQAVQLLLTRTSQGDPDYGDSFVTTLSAVSDCVVRRLDATAD